MWPFTHASSSRNNSIVIEIMPSAVLSRTINFVATSAEREQWVNNCSVAIASIQVPQGDVWLA